MSGKKVIDYLSSPAASKKLARDIEKYYNNKKVRAWVEKVPHGNDFIYVVRSNLKFKVPKI